MPFVRWFEARESQRRLCHLLGALLHDVLNHRTGFPIYCVRFYLVGVDYPFERLPFIANPAFCVEDMCSEARVRLIQKFCFGWHNFKIHDVSDKLRPSFYRFTVPDSCPAVSIWFWSLTLIPFHITRVIIFSVLS